MGRSQVLTGPFLSIPHEVFFQHTDGQTLSRVEYLHLLPDSLTVKVELIPQIRYRGIYEVVVYESQLVFRGFFPGPDVEELNVEREHIIESEIEVVVGISDMRGIQESVSLDWQEGMYEFGPGVSNQDIIESGMRARVLINSTENRISFSFPLRLNGSQSIQFTPLGKRTQIQMESSWATPSFNGVYLPDQREVDETGFKAEWEVLHLNRTYPQAWVGDAFNVSSSQFGVDLLVPIDHYQKSYRTVRYAIMIISLTFLIFFFVEVLNHRRIHPIQYILVGLALTLFYTLLLALSEHIGLIQPM